MDWAGGGRGGGESVCAPAPWMRAGVRVRVGVTRPCAGVRAGDCRADAARCRVWLLTPPGVLVGVRVRAERCGVLRGAGGLQAELATTESGS